MGYLLINFQLLTSRESQISTIEAPQVQIPTVTCDLASDISTSEAGDTVPPPPDERKDTLKVHFEAFIIHLILSVSVSHLYLFFL